MTLAPLRRRLARLLAVAVPLALASPASGYWEYGHRTIATIAMGAASAPARAEVERLLAQSASLDTPTCPATTLEEASVWADCIKPLGERFSYAYSWHYQNVDVCKPFDLAGPCKDGHCVSAQIDRNAKLLADRSLPVRERVMALAFLTHFVGDLHQPMHAGDHGDLGGNRVSANYGVIGGRTNLHSIWDGWLAERAITTPPSGPAALLASADAAERARIQAGTSADWSRQMWARSRALAYGSLLENPCGPTPAARPVLGEAQVRALIPAVRRNVLEGGLRLARLLDEALAPRP